MGLGLAVRMSRLAAAYLLAGRVDEALLRAQNAIDLSRKHRERANEALALKVLADVTAHGDSVDAVSAGAAYTASLALAKKLGMLPLVAHCHLGLGTLYRRVATRRQAEEHLTIALTMYREMGMQLWPERAEAARR